MSSPTLIRQKTPTTCGQCVIAMLFGVSRRRAIDTMGDGITSDHVMRKASGSKAEFVAGAPPAGIVAIQKHKEPGGKREHWTLWWEDKTLDPANLGDKIWPVSKHLVIDWISREH